MVKLYFVTHTMDLNIPPLFNTTLFSFSTHITLYFLFIGFIHAFPIGLTDKYCDLPSDDPKITILMVSHYDILTT